MRKLSRGVVGALLIAAPAVAQRPPVKLPPRPEAAPPKPFVYPKVVVDSLPNGLRFAVIENHELPLVVVRSALAGVGPLGVSFLDPAGKQGAWGLMLMSLKEGTSSRSATQITNEVADLGSEMAFPASGSFTPPSFRAPRSAWRASLGLLADLLVNPTFPAAGLAGVQTSTASLLDRLPSISTANRILYAAAFGAETPYGQFATGASVRGITRDDVVDLQQKYLRPQNTLLVVAGDVTVAEARAALASEFGGWERGGTTVAPIVPAIPAPAPTTIYLKDSPGLAQTTLVGGQLVPGRDHADAAAIEMVATMLGDFSVSVGSRVHQAFRGERGLSYSASAQLSPRPMPEPSVLSVVLTVAPANMDTAVVTLQRVFREFRDSRPPTASDLEFAKRALIGRLPADMERVDLVALNVLLALRDRLPPDYLNKWIGRVNGLTLAEVQAGVKYLDPDHMAIVVVGDRAKIEAPLRATGIPVVIVDK